MTTIFTKQISNAKHVGETLTPSFTFKLLDWIPLYSARRYTFGMVSISYYNLESNTHKLFGTFHSSTHKDLRPSEFD